MEHGTLSKWLKKENDMVVAGDILCEIETDKATMELESVDDGVIGKILIPDNTENVDVNTPIAVLLSAGETMADADVFLKTITTIPVIPALSRDPIPPKDLMGTGFRRHDTPIQTDRIFASPLAKRIANDQGIDLATIQGSGPSGRIVKRDLEVRPITTVADVSIIPLVGMRKVIAKRLTQAKQTIPHFYLTIDVQAERLLAIRASMNAMYKDAKITVNDIIIKACGCALMNVPSVNATFHDDHTKEYAHPHISVAVAIEGGLITPTVMNVDDKTIRQISTDMKVLVDKAKKGQLKPEEYQNGTFTISNLGMFGISHFQAIINPPQVAILAVGTIQTSGVMQLTLSVDHRAVDGANAANFLQKLKLYLEQPEMMLV